MTEVMTAAASNLRLKKFSTLRAIPGPGRAPPSRRSASMRKHRRIKISRMRGRPKMIRFRRYTLG